MIISDLDGPTCTSSLLDVIKSIINTLKPDWYIDHQMLSERLFQDLVVCLAACNYSKIKYLSQKCRHEESNSEPPEYKLDSSKLELIT